MCLWFIPGPRLVRMHHLLEHEQDALTFNDYHQMTLIICLILKPAVGGIY